MQRYTHSVPRELVQGEASHSDNCLNRGSIIAAIVGVNPVFVFLRHPFAFVVINSTSSLVVVRMAKENKVNLVHIPKHLERPKRFVKWIA